MAKDENLEKQIKCYKAAKDNLTKAIKNLGELHKGLDDKTKLNFQGLDSIISDVDTLTLDLINNKRPRITNIITKLQKEVEPKE